MEKTKRKKTKRKKTDCKTLTAKLMNEKLKKNWGTTRFANYLKMSREEFKNILDDTFKGPVGEKYRRELKKNDKQIERHLRRKSVSVKTPKGQTLLHK